MGDGSSISGKGPMVSFCSLLEGMPWLTEKKQMLKEYIAIRLIIYLRMYRKIIWGLAAIIHLVRREVHNATCVKLTELVRTRGVVDRQIAVTHLISPQYRPNKSLNCYGNSLWAYRSQSEAPATKLNSQSVAELLVSKSHTSFTLKPVVMYEVRVEIEENVNFMRL